MKRWIGLAFALAALAGCAPRHVQPFTPRQRVYSAGSYAQKAPNAKPSNGSLFSDANGGYLEDTRAVRVGDFVVIHIDEAANAEGNSTTKLSRESSTSMGANAALGLLPVLQKAYPTLDPAKLLDLASKAGFSGEGDTARKGVLSGNIAVRVVKEMPNGDLFLEGTKVVLINNEEYHLYLSGLARPADIGQDNTLASSRLADAQIEFTGRGDIADQQRKGWLARLIDSLTPW